MRFWVVGAMVENMICILEGVVLLCESSDEDLSSRLGSLAV
jgi:hypothetical protein